MGNDMYSLMPKTSMSGFGSNWGQPTSMAPQIGSGGGMGQPSPGATPGDWSWFDKGGQQGIAAPILGAATGAFNAWMGMKQYGLAKKQLAEGQRQFGLNYDAQRTTTNTQLEDRQRARVASNAGAYQSVGEYMGANSIKPRGG